MPFAEINGTSIHYLDDGRDHPTFVFSNSLGTDVRLWSKLRAFLPNGIRVICYDKRGHGRSAAPKGPYTDADLATDAAALLDLLGVKDCIFVGLSIGGQTAINLAADRPDIVRSAVLSNTAVKLGNPEMWQSRIDAVLTDGIESIADSVMEKWFSTRFRDRRPDEVLEWRTVLTETSEAGYVGCCDALKTADLGDKLKRICRPVLVIAGAEDGAAPLSIVKDTAARIAGAEFMEIAEVGHLPPIEKPEIFAKAISVFATRNVSF